MNANEDEKSFANITWESRINLLLNERVNETLDNLNQDEYPLCPLDFPIPKSIGKALRVPSNIMDLYTMQVVSDRNTILCRAPGKDEKLSINAYHVVRKICDTSSGSLRLCRVLQRRRMNSRKRKDMQEDNSTYNHYDFSDWFWEATNDVVAVKISTWDKMKSKEYLKLKDPTKEVSVLQLIGGHHPNILSVIDVLSDSRNLYVFMPYCADGCLNNLVNNCIRMDEIDYLSEEEARFWFRQLLMGLQHLQMKGLCHRNLSFENILLHNGKLKIADFGMCLRIPYSDPTHEGCVTDISGGGMRRLIKTEGKGECWKYMAPEIIHKESVFDAFAVDLWSAGIILFKLLCGFFPFQQPHRLNPAFYTIACEGRVEELLKNNNVYLSRPAYNLLQNMLWEDPVKRLTLHQVMRHPWVLNLTSGSDYQVAVKQRTQQNRFARCLVSRRQVL